MNTIHVVRQKSTGLYLRMTKFDPDTQETRSLAALISKYGRPEYAKFIFS